MQRRLNYTSRRKILREHATFTIVENDDGEQQFYADIALDGYDLPQTAKIWIEAYDRNAIMRFPFGVAEQPKAETSTVLAAFGDSDSYYFRVKVVDAEHGSRLFASADAIPPLRQDSREESKRSLLRVSTRDLGPVPWILEYPIGDYPLLVINNQIDAGKSLARSNPLFQALVFPTIFEQILRRILIDEKFRPSADSEPDDEDTWKEAWLAFSASLPGNSALHVDQEMSPEQVDQWIEDSRESFCRSLNAVRKIRVELKELE